MQLKTLVCMRYTRVLLKFKMGHSIIYVVYIMTDHYYFLKFQSLNAFFNVLKFQTGRGIIYVVYKIQNV